MSQGLNAAQQEAVRTLSGPLLVLAGAGTGKTRVVTYRIAELIRRGTQPSRILAVTFTNRAAAEMQQRVRALRRGRQDAQPVIGTFHAHCVQILRRHIRKLGYPPTFAIYDRGDQERLARGVLREVRVPGEALRPGELLDRISYWKTRSLHPAQAAAAAGTDKEHLAAVAYRRYQQALKNAGAVDFDDLLLCTEELFAVFPEALREEAARFDHLLVDEYQDTNGSQYRIVKALALPHRNLCVVGDDDQSIYAWRGAKVEHILHFTRDWPDAKVVRLEENYRSTGEILALANRLIAFNRKRHSKTLRATRPAGERPRIEQYKDETEEAEQVVADIARRLQRGPWEPRDCAILCRTNEQPRAFEAALRQAKLPYVLIGASSFFDRKEVRDVLAYLRVLASPADEVSLLRIINTPPRGIGPAAVEAVMQAAVGQGVTLWDVMQDLRRCPALSEAARRGVNDLVSLVRGFRSQLAARPLCDTARDLLRSANYQEALRQAYADEAERESRYAAVEELLRALRAYESRVRHATLAGFLDEVALRSQDFDDEKERQLQRNAVALMTLHSAKGLEFPHVYMVGLEEGLLPHRHSVDADGDAIEEERRLCYVGVTRAQERLTLTMARTRRKWGKPRETVPSRFLFEMIGKADPPPTPAPRRQPRKRTPAARRGDNQ